MIQLASKRKILTTLQKEYPDAIFADVTSKATDDLRKLSPFFPHYDIPVPFTEGMTATCVEAIWQGLKVFQVGGCRHRNVSQQHDEEHQTHGAMFRNAPETLQGC